MLEVGGLSESRALPPSWVRLELEELEETHSAYPALVQEIKAGWINFYGKLPGGEQTQQSSLSSVIKELVETKTETEEVGRGALPGWDLFQRDVSAETGDGAECPGERFLHVRHDCIALKLQIRLVEDLSRQS